MFLFLGGHQEGTVCFLRIKKENLNDLRLTDRNLGFPS